MRIAKGLVVYANFFPGSVLENETLYPNPDQIPSVDHIVGRGSAFEHFGSMDSGQGFTN